MSKKKTYLISILVLLSGAVISSLVFLTEPTAKMEGTSKKTAMLVEVIAVRRGDFKPIVEATGNVLAAKDITLSPRVGGEVVSISEGFIPGSFVKEGEVLLQIDPADYQNIVRLRRSDLQLAQAGLKIEMGRQDVAQKDYELIGDELSQENQSLVLREPQLESAKATAASAQAALDQARIDLQRTTIRAPFDAHVISRNANVGSQVSPGMDLGRLVGMDEYWVVANVPVSKVNRLSFDDVDAEGGSLVKILNPNIWPYGQYREGKLFRLIGALDDQTRLARVLVSVSDPLVRINKTDTLPPLMIGTFVETHIEAKEIKNVVRLNRDYLRKEHTVWVMQDGKLNIRPVNILFEDSRYAYVRSGLSDGEQVITTNLATVVEGSPLRQEENNERSTTESIN